MIDPNTLAPKPQIKRPLMSLSKREFMQKYVLNRALTSAALSGEGAAKEGLLAWNYIENATKEV